MDLALTLNQFKRIDWKKHKKRVFGLVEQKPLLVGGVVIGGLLAINYFGISRNNENRIIEKSSAVDFQKGRILNDRESTFYYGREKLLSQKAQSMLDGQAKLESRLVELEKKLEESKVQGNQNQQMPTVTSAADLSKAEVTTPLLGLNSEQVKIEDLKLFPPAEELKGSSVNQISKITTGKISRKSSDTISFPVSKNMKKESVVLPSGSYVKAKILTGVDVPEGKTYPVLMVLDFSYVAPNDHKIDLTGCFMIAKAEGDLSTERVQMQATKMSCVSKKGKMFEREVNGFVADDKDGSFAMKGEVNSKQGRVASMAFLAGVVDGVGKAVQSTQTTQSTNAFGGSTSVLTGDAGKYAVAGGASNAAGMVAQWYLQQAQNLAPSVSVGSGRDVWIVMKDKVNLPDEFFKKERKANDEGIYSYFTRVLE